MSDYLLINLYDAFKKLQENLDETNRIIAASNLPVWLPESIEPNRQLAADAITECWYQDENVFPLSGLISVSPDHLGIITNPKTGTNKLKQNFKAEIIKLKKASKKKKVSLDKMIESVGRDEEVAEAMKILRISRLNLLWCYRQILVLPKGLNSVSWTWASSHKSILPVTYQEVLDLIDKDIENEGTKNLIKEILTNHQNRKLVQMKKVVPHLRANITYIVNGEKKRKMVTTPTVIISQDTILPRIRWPEKDIKNTRLSRSDIKINPDPIIKALGIYTYINE
ncbi:hypothetical protein MNBD_GAMMA07-474 [hydrothermal vent metagenome]|uniref:DNA replication terminus site-binding protein n=1 Tax=hydrothermal vent metagenome TaxID=652676 RepID=A0A3B0WZZ6_9ZZZZ